MSDDVLFRAICDHQRGTFLVPGTNGLDSVRMSETYKAELNERICHEIGRRGGFFRVGGVEYCAVDGVFKSGLPMGGKP